MKMKLIFNFKGAAPWLWPLSCGDRVLRRGPRRRHPRPRTGATPSAWWPSWTTSGATTRGAVDERGPVKDERRVRGAGALRGRRAGPRARPLEGRAAGRLAASPAWPRSSRSWGEGRPRRRGPRLPAGARGGGGPLPGPHHAHGAAQPGARPRRSTPRAAPSAMGPKGDADTDARPDPRSATRRASRTPSGWALLSPYRVYNALTFGVPGTAMASLRQLSRPPSAGAWPSTCSASATRASAARGPVAMTLADLAVRARTAEILEVLRREATPLARAGPGPRAARGRLHRAAHRRRGVDRTRAMLRQAVAAFAAGRRRARPIAW